MTEGIVYKLVDPRTGEPKYVGATTDPNNRMNTHMNQPTNDEMGEWVGELKEEGMKPIMQEIVEVPEGQIREEESRVLNELGEEYDLLNSQLESKYTPSRVSNSIVRTPDIVREQAREVRDEYDYPSLGEAIRHMCQEGGYDV